MAEVSTKPYLIRAVVQWCNDVGFTPYVAVAVDDTVRVPQPFVKNGEIVLNISSLATNKLDISNEAISFQARFGGVAQSVYVPIQRVIAVYARENGQGMAFEAPRALQQASEAERGEPQSSSDVQSRGAHLRAVEPPKQALTLALEPDAQSQNAGDAVDSDAVQDSEAPLDSGAPKDGKSHEGRAKGKERPQLTRIK